MKPIQSTILIFVLFARLLPRSTALAAGNGLHIVSKILKIRTVLIFAGCLEKYLPMGRNFFMGLPKQEGSMKVKHLPVIVLIVAGLMTACIQTASLVTDLESRQTGQEFLQTSSIVLVSLENDKKVGVCHYTSSNKYQYVELPPPAAEAHKAHEKDIVGARSAAACPKDRPDPTHPPATKERETPDPKPTATDEDDVTRTPGPTKTSRAPTNAPETKTPPATIVTSTSAPGNTGTPVVIQTIPPTFIHTVVVTPTVGATQTQKPTMTVRPTREETHTESTPEASEPAASSELLTLQGQLAQAQRQLDEAREQNRQLDAELKETEAALRATEKVLYIFQGDKSLLEQEAQRLRAMLNNIQAQKALSDQQVESLEKMIEILEKVVERSEAETASSDAQKEQAFWTKVGALMTNITAVLAILFSTWGSNIKDYIDRRKRENNTSPAETAFKNLKAIRVPPSVHRGTRISLEVEAASGTTCQPTITYPSGRLRQLEAKHVSEDCKISWELLIDSSSKPGKWSIRITCFPSGEFDNVKFDVI